MACRNSPQRAKMSIATAPQIGIFKRLEVAGKPSKATKAKRSAEGRRIELLGQMWERRVAANGARDKAALMVLAAEYMVLGHGCPDTASQVTIEAESL